MCEICMNRLNYYWRIENDIRTDSIQSTHNFLVTLTKCVPFKCSNIFSQNPHNIETKILFPACTLYILVLVNANVYSKIKKIE